MNYDSGISGYGSSKGGDSDAISSSATSGVTFGTGSQSDSNTLFILGGLGVALVIALLTVFAISKS
jgi:hypothetical protein